MSDSPESSPVNGHESPVANHVSVQLLDPEPSESDLSDAPAPDVESPSSESQDALDRTAADDRVDDFDDPSSSSDEDAPNDDDFDDLVAPPSPGSNDEHIEAVASDDSRSGSKRKAGVSLEDDYIRENPELYGLRRSVCRLLPRIHFSSKINKPLLVSPTAASEDRKLLPSRLQ